MSHGSNTQKGMFAEITQIGVIVRNLERTISVLSDIFGIGPFQTIVWPPIDRTDIQKEYHGKPGNFSARLAFANLGSIDLELIQPIKGESVWTDFLKEHGEGIHHVKFNVPDLEPVIEHLTMHGIEVDQMGAGLRPGTAYAYFNTEQKIGFTIEVMKALPDTDGRVPPIVDGEVQV